MEYEKLAVISIMFVFGSVIIGFSLWYIIDYFINPCNRYGHKYKHVGNIESKNTFIPKEDNDTLRGSEIKVNSVVYVCKRCKKIKINKIFSSYVDL